MYKAKIFERQTPSYDTTLVKGHTSVLEREEVERNQQTRHDSSSTDGRHSALLSVNFYLASKFLLEVSTPRPQVPPSHLNSPIQSEQPNLANGTSKSNFDLVLEIGHLTRHNTERLHTSRQEMRERTYAQEVLSRASLKLFTFQCATLMT